MLNFISRHVSWATEELPGRAVSVRAAWRVIAGSYWLCFDALVWKRRVLLDVRLG